MSARSHEGTVLVLGIAAAIAATFGTGACGSSAPTDQTSSSSSSSRSATSSGASAGSSTSSTGSASSSGAAPCVMNPTTYVDIINGCTDAQQVDVTPVLPLLAPDGGLPPLP